MTYWQAVGEILSVVACLIGLACLVLVIVAPVLLFKAWGLFGTVPMLVLFMAFIHWRESNNPVSY
jgi:hypothetical protein